MLLGEKGTCHISAKRACSYQEQGKAPAAASPSPQMAAELKTLFPGHVFLVSCEAASLKGKQISLSAVQPPGRPSVLSLLQVYEALFQG